MTERREGMLIVISGPSGTGKGTLVKKLLDVDPTIQFSISYTTRKRRDTELDGVDYHFISEEEYDELLESGAFLEHATVHGHRYGTPAGPIDEGIKQGRSYLLDIDPQGAMNVMKMRPDCVSIFILPPSYEALRVRLHTRSTDDPVEIARRLKNARGEVKQLHHYRYVIVNDNLDLAFEQLKHIIAAERQRTTRYFPQIEEQ